MANSSDNVKKVNRVAKDIEKLLERKRLMSMVVLQKQATFFMDF